MGLIEPICDSGKPLSAIGHARAAEAVKRRRASLDPLETKETKAAEDIMDLTVTPLGLQFRSSRPLTLLNGTRIGWSL